MLQCSRRTCLILGCACLFLFYTFPNIFHIFSDTTQSTEDIINQCLEDRLVHFYYDKDTENPFLYFIPEKGNDKSFFPFVGNGFFGVPLISPSFVHVKDSRTLSSNTEWNPIVSVQSERVINEVYATQISQGTVHRYQCFENGLQVSYSYYAHRTLPSLFYQEIKILNPTSQGIRVLLNEINYPAWATTDAIRMPGASMPGKSDTHAFSGIMKNYSNPGEALAIAVTMKKWPTVIEMQPHWSTSINIPCIIHQEQIQANQFNFKKTSMEHRSNEKVISSSSLLTQQNHVDSWKKTWMSGLYISESKAAGALNGDLINATLYYVLSSVQMNNTNRETKSLKTISDNYGSVAEGCYGGYHHTLQAVNLWKSLSTFKGINDTVSLWLLTLEKQGCHKLVSTGVEGTMQAMVLSFGGFRFNAHHLEFKIDPKFLHREYIFRRIKYTSNTFINITVTLQDDNKAVLGVSLDTPKDRHYYACEGGCNHNPVEISPKVSYFPVKVTDPITSILYITSDKSHMELIKDTLHVHKIVEAPAHDHHVIALHKHGHHLGGLPLMFWASVCFLIVIFHLFLFKLIFNEYCGKQDKFKTRYSKI